MQTREVGQMSSGPAPSQWGIDTGAKSWDGTGLAWLGLLQRTVTNRRPELASRSTVYLAEQDKRQRFLTLPSLVPLSRRQEILERSKV